MMGSNASESSSGDLPPAVGLSAFMNGLQKYSELMKLPNRDSLQLSELRASLCDQGIHGEHAQHLLRCTKQQFSWQALDSEAFQLLYRFMYLLCREPGKRFITMERANGLWKVLLHGRFRRLKDWCAFTEQSDAKIVTEDTWCQVLEFSRHILEDLSNYDINSAWPTLIDEFVSHVRCEHWPLKETTSMSPSALAHAGLLPDRVSPKAGSKRKLTDCDAEELAKRFASMYRDETMRSISCYNERTCRDKDVQMMR
eukprot:jgi/Ulvmu1/11250/UM073_0022.1